MNNIPGLSAACLLPAKPEQGKGKGAGQQQQQQQRQGKARGREGFQNPSVVSLADVVTPGGTVQTATNQSISAVNTTDI